MLPIPATLSRRSLIEYLPQYDRGRFSVLLILEPEYDTRYNELSAEAIEVCREYAPDTLVQRYHDVDSRTLQMLNTAGQRGIRITEPTFEDIKQAVEWADGKHSLLISCRAGQRRSSAMRYIISSMQKVNGQYVSPNDAIRELDYRIHDPNQLLVSHAARGFGRPEIHETFNTWLATGGAVFSS